jgi:ABC-2 type transport system ATP-binding protein
VPEIEPAIVLLIAPVLLIQLGLAVLGLIDLLRPERRVRGGNKAIWAVVIVLVNLVGPIVYFLAGRDERPVEPEATPAPGPGAIAGWQAPTDGAPTPGQVAGTFASPVASSLQAVPRSDPDPTPVIVVDGLTKRYPGPGGGVLALDRLSLVVPTGSVFGLLGPNGAGKSTTLRLLVGLTRPTAGSATVAGHRLPDETLDVRRRLGFLEQEPRAYGWMTGRQQLRMVGELHGLRGPALTSAVNRSLERAGLGGAAGRRIAGYSGGMRQRLGIAAALVHRPPVIVLDEPVSSLDPEGRRDVLNLIHELKGEATVLFSTHVLADVERICDRVGIIDHGRLIVEGPLDALLERYALPVYRIEAEPGQGAELASLAEQLRTRPWVTETRVEHGLLTVAVADPATAARELLGAVADSRLAVLSLARARPTLEDVFLQLTGANGTAVA